eukprot:449101_1
MGNRNSTTNKTSTDDQNIIKMYSRLINMGFDDAKSMKAANKYPNNLNKAIDYINNDKYDSKTKKTEILNSDKKNDEVIASTKNNTTNKTSTDDDSKVEKTEILNNDKKNDEDLRVAAMSFGGCESVETCSSINRIIKYLIDYQKIDITKTDNIYSKDNYPYLIDDFHHILLQHLSDKNSILRNKKEYESIYDYIMSKIGKCTLDKCNSFARNNRNRERENIFSSINKENNIGWLGYVVSKFKINDNNNNYNNNNDETETKTETETSGLKFDTNVGISH